MYCLSREDCAYINIQAVRELYASAKDIGMILDKSVKEEKSGYEVTKSLSCRRFFWMPVRCGGFIIQIWNRTISH